MIVGWQGQQLLLRPVTEIDKAFVYSTWLRSYRDQQVAMHRAEYFVGQRRRVDKLWDKTFVASSPDVPISIHAWACGEGGLLHYVYVPPELRGKGLARLLVGYVCGDRVQYTHRWPFARVPSGWRPNEYRNEDP